jgi:hypothetical protein
MMIHRVLTLSLGVGALTAATEKNVGAACISKEKTSRKKRVVVRCALG